MGVAKSHKKMIKILAMDCSDGGNKKHCDRIGVKNEAGAPWVHFYPQSPQPHFRFTGTMDATSITKKIRKMMGQKVQLLDTSAKFTEFKNKNPAKQKVILFSDKEKVPVLAKGLSTDSVFARTVEFGYVYTAGAEGAGIQAEVGKNAKKTPSILMFAKNKPMWYGHKKDHAMDYLSMHEWINVNSESGMGDKVKDASGFEAEVEEIEAERVSELTGKTLHDLCLKQKAICAVYITKDGALEDKEADLIQNLEQTFRPKNDRGAQFNWVWADGSLQKELIKTIEAQEQKVAEKRGESKGEPFTLPTVIMVKPPRKKRDEKFFSYLRLGADVKVDKDSIKAMIEKISGGATYSRTDVPKLAARPKADAKKAAKGREEL